ncbi:MAG: phage tail tape measure protein, partial [Paracoccus sp. (in: a-proteobacteria)]
MSDFNVGMTLNAKDGLSPTLKRAGKAVADTGQKINRFAQMAGTAGQRTANFGRRILGIIPGFRRYGQGARQASRDLEQFTRSQNKATQAAGRFKKIAMGAFAGAALAMGGQQVMGGVGGVMGTAMEYGAAIDKVAAVANIRKGSADYNMLDTQAKELGANTWASSSQVASGQQFLAMAGFNPKAIKEAMPSMLDLAKGGDLDLGATADITSNVLSGYGMEAKETGRLADVMAATITTSNTNLSMLGDTMKYVAPIASKMNGTIEEGAAMAGMLGNVGIQGSMAGTAMRAMYSRMASPPKMAQDAMDSIGLSIKDANGQLKSMPTLLKEIAEKTSHLDKDQQMDIFKRMAGEEAMAGMAELVKQAGTGALDEYIKKLEASMGRAQDLSRQMSDNLKGD